MTDSDRIGELVQRCEDLRALAIELDLDFVAFMANVLLVEARKTHYLAQEEAGVAALPVHDGNRAAAPQMGHVATVTQLAPRRKASA